MAAFLGTTAFVTQLGLVGIEIGIIGAASTLITVGLYGIHKARKAL